MTSPIDVKEKEIKDDFCLLPWAVGGNWLKEGTTG